MTTIDSSIFTNKNISRIDIQQKTLIDNYGTKQRCFHVSTNDNKQSLNVFNYELALNTKDFLMNRKNMLTSNI